MRLAPLAVEFVDEPGRADIQIVSVCASYESIFHERAVVYLHNSVPTAKLTPEAIGRLNGSLLVASWCPSYGALLSCPFVVMPQGIDDTIFAPHIVQSRDYDVITTGWVGTENNGEKGEPIFECHDAGRALHVGPKFKGIESFGEVSSDVEMASLYSRARYVSALRWHGGFENPALEGLMCGCRPIMFDLPDSMYWYREHVVAIDHTPEDLTGRLADVFAIEPQPVSIEERNYLKLKFNWGVVAQAFWNAVLEHHSPSRKKPNHGLRVRPGGWDEQIIKAVMDQNEYRIPDKFESTDVIIDIGAHIGSFSVECLRRGAGKVVAIEPDTSNYDLLIANLERELPCGKIPPGQQWIAHPNAVWGSSATVRFGGHSQCSSGTNYGGGNVLGPNGEEVKTVTLDILLDLHGPVRLLKIDCEGSEWQILFNSKHLDQVHEIAGEYHEVREGFNTPEEIANATVEGRPCVTGELVAFLESQGFKVLLGPRSENIGLFFAKRQT